MSAEAAQVKLVGFSFLGIFVFCNNVLYMFEEYRLLLWYEH